MQDWAFPLSRLLPHHDNECSLELVELCPHPKETISGDALCLLNEKTALL